MRSDPVRIVGHHVAVADQTVRVLRLLALLTSARSWRGEDLAARLGVTTRTVRRDVERLRELGYRVDAAPGPAGGYVLGPGTDLPPLLLDEEAAVTVAVALHLAASGAVGSAEEAAVRATSAVEQVLPARLRRRVAALQSATVSLPGGGPAVEAGLLGVLALACRDGARLRFSYTDRDGTGSRRHVEPYRLVCAGRRWYLVARDLDRDDWRSFRVDRMTDVYARTWHFRPRTAPDAATYVQEGVASRVYRFQARFLVHAPADTVRRQIPASAAVVQRRGSDLCEVLSGADSLDFVLMHVVLLGHDFEVLEPPQLASRCRALAQRLLSAVPPAPDTQDEARAPS
jgi:predicted DNA-binding transcriptional regulator YafY